VRKLLTALTLAGLITANAVADDKKPDPDKKKETTPLKVGDAAPQLKVSKWLQGKEVPEFAAGKIYIVEFWATWCGPCIVMMPHLSEMQSEYKDKGLTVIGFTAKDPNNTEEKVSTFVTKRGPKLGYTFAYADNRDTYDAWMNAAGQNGIPCSFVVDQKGKLAYIGHPMFLGEVLPKVIAGSWNIVQGATELAEAEKDVDALFGKFNGSDGAATLKALEEFETKRPGLAKIPYFTGPKISLLIKVKRFDDAKKMADEVLAKAIEQDDSGTLRGLAAALASPEAKAEKGFTERSLKAADEFLKVAGDKDLSALLTAAQAYFAAGDKEKARSFGKQAIDVAPERYRPQIEEIIKKFDEAKTDEKKDEKKDGEKKEDKK
jgi:thiol-disulfide isomerase/thioredoxin